MKPILHTTALIIMSIFHQSASAYSPIWNVEGWDAARLKDAGITVTTRKHDCVAEEPTQKESSLKWIEITYDASKLTGEQEVFMIFHLISDDHKTIFAQSVERKKGDPGKMKLHFVVNKENVKNSYVQIVVPQLVSEGSERSFGDPGFGGYSIGLSRVLQLAAQDVVVQKEDAGKEPLEKFVPNEEGGSVKGNANGSPLVNRPVISSKPNQTNQVKQP